MKTSRFDRAGELRAFQPPLSSCATQLPILTALFLYTIFVATRPDFTPGFTALAIGGFLFIAHLVGAQLGDSSLNPARSIGPALFVRGDALKVLWVFIIAPVFGGILGWVLYKLLHDDTGTAGDPTDAR